MEHLLNYINAEPILKMWVVIVLVIVPFISWLHVQVNKIPADELKEIDEENNISGDW